MAEKGYAGFTGVENGVMYPRKIFHGSSGLEALRGGGHARSKREGAGDDRAFLVAGTDFEGRADNMRTVIHDAQPHASVLRGFGIEREAVVPDPQKELVGVLFQMQTDLPGLT